MERDNIIKLILFVTLLVTIFATGGTKAYWFWGGLIVCAAFVLWTRKKSKDNGKEKPRVER